MFSPPRNASRPLSICFAEDNELVRGHISDLLEADGHRIVAAVGTVVEAERAVTDHLPDLAVIDGRLPDGSGIDLCRRLRLVVPKVPLILYTATISSEDRRTALELEVAAVVLKNVHTDELLEAVRRIGAI